MKLSKEDRQQNKLRQLYQEWKDLPPEPSLLAIVLGVETATPEQQSRAKEIERRMVEISGKPRHAVIRDVMEAPSYRKDLAWKLPTREQKRAEIVEREMKREAEQCALERLIERRGGRSYHDICSLAPHEGPTKSDYERALEEMTHEEEMQRLEQEAEEIKRRRPEPGVPLEEKARIVHE